MKKENVNIEISGENVAEINIRHGEAPPPLLYHAVGIHGSIESVAEYIKKRKDEIDTKRTHILIDRDNAKITLHDGEDHMLETVVTGKMIMTTDFDKFKINGTAWDSPKQLGEFLRRQKRWFVDKAIHAKLVDSLLKFKATVQREVEKSDNKRGATIDIVMQKVTTDIPERFLLEIPIFKGCKPTKFEVELFFDMRDAGCKINLDSLEADEAAAMIIDQRLNEQLPHFEPYVTVEV